MEILKYVAGGYIALCCFFVLIGLFYRVKVDKIYRIGVVLLSMASAVFAFCFQPDRGLDLFRLQKYAETVNFNGSNFLSSIWGAEGTMAGVSLSGMVSFNFLCYIVRLIGDVRWLSTIGVFTTLCILLSVLVDYLISNKYSSQEFGLGVILTFVGMQVQYIFSGIRNGMAVALVVLGAYLLFYKKRGIIASVVLFLLGATMHPAVLILIVPILFCRVKRQKLVRLFALFSLPLIFLSSNILKLIPLPFLQYVGNRISFYEDVQYPYDRPEMIADLLIFITLGVLVWIRRKNGTLSVEPGLEEWYLNAYYILGSVMIGCSLHRDFVLRIGYLMGIMAVPIACRMIAVGRTGRMKMNYISAVLAAVIVVCASKVFYDTALGFSRWNFM